MFTKILFSSYFINTNLVANVSAIFYFALFFLFILLILIGILIVLILNGIEKKKKIISQGKHLKNLEENEYSDDKPYRDFTEGHAYEQN